MSVTLLTEHHLEFLSLKGTAQALLSLHLSKCHIVRNHMPRLKMCCLIAVTVLPAKSDSDLMFCLQSYQRLRIDGLLKK